MTNYFLALPYLPGGIEADRKFAVDECGHRKEHDEFYNIAGVNRVNIWIQRSPPGSGVPGPLPPLNELIVDWRISTRLK